MSAPGSTRSIARSSRCSFAVSAIWTLRRASRPTAGSVRDEARKAEVLDNVAREAEAAGLEPERLRAVWNELVEQSIAYEATRWDRLRADS
jgi:chorismate mutase